MNTIKYQVINNIDYKEIAKFETVATQWWDLKGKLKLLHDINQLRLSYIIDRSRGIFGKNVLDVGCGGGILSESMAREGAKVTGIDMGAKLLQIARLHSIQSGIQVNYIQETVEKHVIRYYQQYDIITCMEVLEHIPHPELIVNACSKLVKPGGHVFFSTINRNHKSWLVTIVIAEYLLRIMPRGTHNVKKFIKPAKLLSWIDQTNLQEQHITGLYYNLMLGKFKLCLDVSINYILHVTAQNN